MIFSGLELGARTLNVKKEATIFSFKKGGEHFSLKNIFPNGALVPLNNKNIPPFSRKRGKSWPVFAMFEILSWKVL